MHGAPISVKQGMSAYQDGADGLAPNPRADPENQPFGSPTPSKIAKKES
jgi:hypothetical protein